MLSPRLLVITCTFERPTRREYLARCINVFRRVANLHWLVVEDASDVNPTVAKLLAESGIDHTYLHAGPSHDWGGTQKDFALCYIREHALDGIIYIADDDNGYDLRLFNEIRKTKRISVFPVGDLGPAAIEKPILKKGKIVGWISGWDDRKYPIDTGGFAFHSSLLKSTTGSLWPNKNRGGETELLEKLVRSTDEFEPICRQCRRCYVIHNLPLNEAFYPYLRKVVRVRQKLLVEIWIRQSWIGDLFRRLRKN